MKAIFNFMIFGLMIFNISGCGGSDGGPIGPLPSKPDTGKAEGGYLFIHMKPAGEYARLYYSLSRDGIEWIPINKGKRIMNDFLGHPTLAKGKDGMYYMIGYTDGAAPHNAVLYWSKDLITWKHKQLDTKIFATDDQGYRTEVWDFGAPKFFYDESSDQFLITWHTHLLGLTGEPKWMEMRTFYILTKDWENFSKPKKLFNFTGSDEDMATIDVFIRKDKGTYYAIIKDERWPDKFTYCPTGKSIRVATSQNLLGPYTNPGAKITPNWREAPTLVKSPNGQLWYLYAEDYGSNTYMLYTSKELTGSGANWTEYGKVYSGIKHGWVHQVSEDEYKALLKAFPN